MVLNNGIIEEFDKPIDLINNPDSYLRKLAKENGEDYFNDLLKSIKVN